MTVQGPQPEPLEICNCFHGEPHDAHIFEIADDAPPLRCPGVTVEVVRNPEEPETPMVTIRLPLAHWHQIVDDIENMCGTSASEIEILQNVKEVAL